MAVAEEQENIALIEEQVVGEREDPQVRLNLGLAAEEAGMASLSRKERFHVVAQQGVEKSHPIRAGEDKPAPIGEVEESTSGVHGFVGLEKITRERVRG